jgi:polygalacturonase
MTMIKTAPSLICAMLLALIPAFATAGGKHFNVTDFGAEARPEVINTQAIQSAIDAARKAGGGKVVVPAGTFVSGTLELYSHITLHLEEGAMIFGSADLADYRRGHWPALVMAKDAQHIGITGKGTLHGNSQELRKQFDRIRASGNALEFFPQAVEGEELDIIGPTGVVTRFNPYEMQQKGELMAYVYGNFTRPFEFVRPQIIEFWGCSHIEVRDITLRGAACWVQTYRNCTDILIQGIKVRSNDYWNNDGIDLVDCHRVSILDCDIDSADDALCLKSDPRGIGCEDIVVERCILATHASAVKFGTASHNTFKRIRISDIVVREAYRSVVAIQSVDGAVIDDVVIERVRRKTWAMPFSSASDTAVATRNPARSAMSSSATWMWSSDLKNQVNTWMWTPRTTRFPHPL